MASIRELRSRIKSVQATKKITKAQELIAGSRIAKAQRLAQLSAPYAEKITRAISSLASHGNIDNPFLFPRAEIKKAAVFLVTSDSGQCGGYNANVFKTVDKLIKSLKDAGKQVEIYVAGRKGIEHYKFKDVPLEKTWSGFSQSPNYGNATDIGRTLEASFIKSSKAVDGVDEVYMVYTEFISMLSQKPRVIRLAPVEFQVENEVVLTGESLMSNSPSDSKAQYDFEPDAETLLAAIFPKYLYYRIHAAMLESAASENAARRTAMQTATDNAEELERTLSRQANQARQASITQEITEIVGATSALGAN